jgi:competence protein ComEC
MKLPAVAIVAAFALGVSLGLTKLVVSRASSRAFLCWLLVGAFASLLLGLAFFHFKHIFRAATAAVVCWALLGMAGALSDEAPRPANHIVALANSGCIDLRSPLRFHGRLRDEPEKLPWGTGYEVELTGVEAHDALLPATGGLRFTFAPHSKEQHQAATLHAGAVIAVLLQAKLPQMYRDEGAFDRRAYLARQGIDLVGSLRAPELLTMTQPGGWTFSSWLARSRRRLGEQVDALWPTQPQVAGVMRAMLLGDRNFVDRDESQDFQKTGAFHVLVVAGLHVGAVAMVLVWISRKLRLSRLWTAAATLTMLLVYVAIVEQRTPVLRAVLMAAIVIVGRFFFRRLELLNSTAVAALVLLVYKPTALADSSFQLSFLAVSCISGLAMPWFENTVQPYARALKGWRDVTRDRAQEPRAIQFRIDLRLLARSMESRLPARVGRHLMNLLVRGIGCSFRLWEMFALALVIQIGMLPLLAAQFHRVTFAGPLVNFAAVPLTGVIVPLGFLTLISSLFLLPVGKLLAAPVSWLMVGLLHAMHWFAGIGRLSYRVPSPQPWVMVAAFVTLTALAASFRWQFSSRRIARWSICGLLAAALVAVGIYPFSPQRAAGKLEVSVLDVGQGDSLFVVTPAGKTLLIDGGGAFGGFAGQPAPTRGSDPGEEAVSPYLWSRGFKAIDVVALTHAHQDHLGGLTAVLENFRVGRLWIGREVNNTALAKLEALAHSRNVAIEYEAHGKQFSLDGVDGAFLWPEQSEREELATAKNNDSLVMRLKFGNESVLLPGDAEKQVEHALLEENNAEDLHSDVLKIGHHGSKNSTTEEFLRAVHPRVAIISAGEDNPYGHPSPEALQRLEAAGVRVLRTDHDGAVHVITDGQRLEISCFLPCPEPPAAAAVPTSGQSQTPDHD